MSVVSHFENLNFERFRELANTDGLSRHVKVGFPDAYREGKEEAILSDMIAKLSPLRKEGSLVLDIGPGCSHLPRLLSAHCKEKNHKLLLVDSEEMLKHTPDASHIEKYAGKYPEAGNIFDRYTGQVDAIITYSVIQYVFADGNLWNFLDKSLALLADGGEMLIGDIPNTTMRKRFFASNNGIRHHQQFTGTDEIPEVKFNNHEAGNMDDSVIFSILMRARAEGCHAWVLPQREDLPMANRREDILIKKP